jgi:hypothetical protein
MLSAHLHAKLMPLPHVGGFAFGEETLPHHSSLCGRINHGSIILEKQNS